MFTSGQWAAARETAEEGHIQSLVGWGRKEAFLGQEMEEGIKMA